ncbi:MULTISPECIES: hypothetical protein [unclassified Bacillus (in: firmicutes)]|uniref:hypothetical protein n=1 Tax=unclassified Bacillus (in: firmicutes) TaxID=185979 RepID=UPI00300FE7BF
MQYIPNFFPLNMFQRNRIHNLIHERRNEVFDIKKITELVIENVRHGYTRISDIYGKVDLTQVILNSAEMNTYFECPLIKGNHAWISMSETGHCRYFTRSKADVTNSLDLIDLLSVYYNEKIGKTIRIANHKFGLIWEDRWLHVQSKRYEENIDSLECILPKRYPCLHKLVGDRWELLKAMNRIGLNTLVSKHLSYQNQAIFFVSIKYLKYNYFPNYSVSVINQCMNLFAVLGFVRKMKDDEIPLEFLNQAKEEMKKNKEKRNIVSFYLVENVEDTMEIAEERAKILIKHNIKYHTLTKDKVSHIFGDEFSKNIYVQETSGGSKKLKHERGMLEDYFHHCYKEYGYVAKENLITLTTMKEKTIDKIWKELVSGTNGVVFRLNPELRELLNLKSRSSIVIDENRVNEVLTA